MTREDLYEQYAQKVVDDMGIDDLMSAVQDHIAERLENSPKAEALEEIRESAYSDLLDEYESGKDFSLPEVPEMMDEATYLRVSEMVTCAATLFGNGAGGDLGDNEEYERGIAEMIIRSNGLSVDSVEGVIQAIHNVAKEAAQ